MPRFQPKAQCAPHDAAGELTAAKSDARARLRQAIEAQRTADALARDLEAAEAAAFDKYCAAANALDDLRERHAKEPDGAADAFISSMRDGADCSVETLEAPARARAAELVEAEREVAVLDRVRGELADRLPGARQVAEDAVAKVVNLAKEVLREQTDVEQLIARHDAAYAALADARARLRFAGWLLPHPESQAILRHLDCAYRNDDRHADVKHDPANAGLVELFEALLRDPDGEASP